MDALALSQEILDAARARDGRIQTLAARLSRVEPGELIGDAARVAFWVNVYNALTRHAIVAFGIHGNLRAHRGFFHRAVWHVGGLPCSLHQMEHGILRVNRPAPWTFWRPLRSTDPRLAWAPSRLDPRIHFALNCGAGSCPPIQAYSGVDDELSLATRSYLDAEVACGESLRLPYLCKLYRSDFGNLRAFVAEHVDAERAGWIRANPGARIVWGEYRWEIGSGP